MPSLTADRTNICYIYLSLSLSRSLKRCVLVGVNFAITIAITMATATATILSNIDMPLLLQTGMCIHRSRTNGRIDALLSHSVILPFKRSWQLSAETRCSACFCCLTAAVSTIRHRGDPKALKSRSMFITSYSQCHIRYKVHITHRYKAQTIWRWTEITYYHEVLIISTTTKYYQ